MILFWEDEAWLRSPPADSLNIPWFRVIMLPVDCMFFVWKPDPFDFIRVPDGVDFELSLRAVFGTFFPVSSPIDFCLWVCLRLEPMLLAPFLL